MAREMENNIEGKERTGFVQPGEDRTKNEIFLLSNYLMGYSVGFLEEGARLSSKMHNGRMGSNRCKLEHRKLPANIWILFLFFKHWGGQTELEAKYWIRDHKTSILELNQTQPCKY